MNALQFFVLGLDRLHRLVDGLADVLTFGKVQQLGEASLGRQIHDPRGLVIFLADDPSPGAFARQFLLGDGELEVGIPQEDQASGLLVVDTNKRVTEDTRLVV